MPSTLDKIEETLAARRERAATLEAEIHACDAQKEEARLRSLRLDPTKRSDVGGANSEVGRIARKKKDRESELRNLLEEIAGLEVLAGEHRGKVAEDSLRAEIKTALGYRLEELDLFKQMATKLVDEFGDLWVKYGELMTRADAHAVSVDHGGLLSAAPHLEWEWLTASRPAVQPVPTDIMAAITKLYEAASDPAGIGTRVEDGVRTSGRVMPTLTSDRPELNRRLSLQGMNHLSGNFERTAYERARPNAFDFEAVEPSAASEVAQSIVAELVG